MTSEPVPLKHVEDVKMTMNTDIAEYAEACLR